MLEENNVPSYMIAADIHNIANGNDSFFDAATLGTGAVLASATAQTLNILPTVANWFGADVEEIKTKDILQNFDSEFSNYYQQHQEGVDALGFAISAIVPGTAGTKVFNAGQKVLTEAIKSGTIGGNLAAATGLLVPSQPKLLAAAIESAVKPNAGFPIWNANTVKAVSAGFGQAAMEGAAFETAVAATMYNSPVLQNQDFGDIVSNIMWGAGAFGAIGGTINTAKTYFQIKKVAKSVDIEAAPWNAIADLSKEATHSDRLVNYFDQLHSIPAVPKYEGEFAWKTGKFEALKEQKIRAIQTDIRGLANDISKGDSELGQKLYDHWMKMDAATVESKLFSTEQFARLGTKTEYESQMAKATKTAIKSGDMAAITDLPNKSLLYVKIAGEGLGKTTTEAPAIVNIADDLAKGESYNSVVSGYGQRLSKKWDPFDTNAKVAEARYVTAAKHEFKPDEVIEATDIPYLQRAYFSGHPSVQVRVADGGTVTFGNSYELHDFIIAQKQAIATELLRKGKSVEEAAKIADIKESLFHGSRSNDFDADFFLTKTGKEWDGPQWTKVVKDLTPVQDTSGHLLDGMVAIKQKQVLAEQAADRATAAILGENSAFFRVSSADVVKGANRVGVGGGFVSSQNENYGTLASLVQALGNFTTKLARTKMESAREALNPVLYKVATKQEAAIELSVLNNTLRGLPEVYGLDGMRMRPRKLIEYERALAKGEDVKFPVLGDDIPLEIPIKNAEVAEFAALHIERNGDKVEKLGAIRSNQGARWNRDREGFYPIPPNTKDYPHFAFAVDDSVTGYGHHSMIYAASAEDLEKQITAVKAADPTLKLYTKKEAEEYYKSIGQFEFERTLTDSTFDGALKRKGISAQLVPSTDPQKITSDFLNWHLQRETNLVREAVMHQNEAALATLRNLGENYNSVKGSHFTNIDPLAYIEMQGNNPFADYAKTMLGLGTKKDYPYWTSFNDMLDRKVSAVYNNVREAFSGAKQVKDLERINQLLEDSGYPRAKLTPEMLTAVNHSAPSGVLSSFVQKANALLSLGVLGLDPINAVVNVVGSSVVRSPELTSLLRGIATKNPELAGELAHIKVPGTGDSVLSPAKMIGRAMKDFTSDEGRALREQLKSMGIISTRAEQSKWVLDNLAFTGKESVKDLDSKVEAVFSQMKKWADKGEAITGNKLAEEFNRFVSAHVAKQITDIAVEQGIMDSRRAWAYVNTFVNRAEGNYLASQRPGVFQGPIGQAIGLFQTYQFNLLQQLFRHVGEGSAKDVALMMGIQGTIFGAKGLPAFDAINTHLVGNASGNTQHRDLYDTVFGAAGKEAGDWLMYGVGSNALGIISPDLKFNLYTRGDINPRNVTLLPVNPANVPFIQASTKLFGSLKETAGKIAMGGNVWSSMLQGIEHAGVNRPLAGLAQTLQAAGNPMERSYSTSNKGNVIASNDFLSLANMIRIAGAKPLDEAIAIDRVYNLDVYAAKDSERRNKLGEAVKTTLIAGNHPSQEQIESFAEQYAAAGGKQDKFAQWMMQQYKSANTSQANALSQSLHSPFSQSMQNVMGGMQMKDFTNGSFN